MNIDIRLSLEFFDHPKTKKLRKRLGIEGVMALLKLWAWTAGNRPGGILTGLDAEAVELAADWDGEEGAFVAELLALRLLDEDDSVFSIHDWEEHQAYASKSEERSSKARKAAEARWSKAQEMPEKSASNAHSMLGNATSIQEHAVSNAPETRSQKPVFNISTPDGVVADAVGVSLPTEPDSGCTAKEEMPSGELLEPVPRASKATKPVAPPCPHKQIVELYHEILPTLPRVKVWDSERERNMQARWRERWESGKYTTQEEGLAYWRRLFVYIHGCPWLMGEVADRDGKAFRADLGWIILPRNFKKIIEGRYDQRQEVA